MINTTVRCWQSLFGKFCASIFSHARSNKISIIISCHITSLYNKWRIALRYSMMYHSKKTHKACQYLSYPENLGVSMIHQELMIFDVNDYLTVWLSMTVAAFALTHWGRVTPSHYLNQCWNIVNWTLRNKLHWNSSRKYNIIIKNMRLKVSSAKWRPCCLGLNVLICLGVTLIIINEYTYSHSMKITNFTGKSSNLLT